MLLNVIGRFIIGWTEALCGKHCSCMEYKNIRIVKKVKSFSKDNKNFVGGERGKTAVQCVSRSV